MLAEKDLTDPQGLHDLMTLRGGTRVVTGLELLFPEGGANGLSFEEESMLGEHICRSTDESGALILRQCVPVQQNGAVAAVLCGTIDLTQLPHLFYAQEYGESMQFYILEAETGQFLLDTWHDRLTKKSELSGRKPGRGYSKEKFDADLAARQTGHTVFRSNTAGENFYTSYTAIPVEDWMLLVTVPASVAFSYAGDILWFLYVMTALLVASFAVYFVWIVRDMRRDQKESERKLENIHYILDVEKNLFQAHTDPVYFRDALRRIAAYLPAEEAFFWAMEDEQATERRWWSSSGVDRLDRSARLVKLFPKIYDILVQTGSFHRYGLLSDETISAEERRLLREVGISSLMMLPVKKRDGELVGVLGAANLLQRWDSTEPLEQVALSFSITAEQYDSYRRMAEMSQIDAMTGLMNRNGYHNAIDALANERLSTFACVYADANSLHEINNHLGHQEGDEMLITVAQVLRKCFPDDNIYRIGGDEFVVLCCDRTEHEVYDAAERVQEEMRKNHYALSIGIAWRASDIRINEIVDAAEISMRADKQRYYEGSGRQRLMRLLDEKNAQMILEKQDMATFLSVLAPQFKGVYFVDLGRDSVRHIFIPAYFEKILREENDCFSKSLIIYAEQLVKPLYRARFREVCDYEALERRLNAGEVPELVYEKIDGSRLQLQVRKVHNDNRRRNETLWIFMDI